MMSQIQYFNVAYKDATPKKKITVSNQVSRPNSITDYLKRIRNYTCQICNEVGFFQRNGSRYIEAHHIIELHKLIPGALCSDNIIIVCATCHRKLHYAAISYKIENTSDISICIGNNHFNVERNIISVSQ
jgi:5-methylcytosine-specific restriction endonuclease McrA